MKPNKTIYPEYKRKFEPAINRDCKTCLRKEADIRFAVDNGLALSKKAHKEFHKN